MSKSRLSKSKFYSLTFDFLRDIDIEMQRKRSEKNLRMYNAREKMAEEEVKHQEAEKEVFEKEWSEENR